MENVITLKIIYDVVWLVVGFLYSLLKWKSEKDDKKFSRIAGFILWIIFWVLIAILPWI